jgi:hypothetical protein
MKGNTNMKTDSITQLLKEQKEIEKFNEEVISPLADKIINEIASSKLSYKQVSNLLDLVEDRIKNTIPSL